MGGYDVCFAAVTKLRTFIRAIECAAVVYVIAIVASCTEDDTDLLVSIMMGLEYTNSQQVTWSIKYRHAWADTGKNGVDDAEADNVIAYLKIAF